MSLLRQSSRALQFLGGCTAVLSSLIVLQVVVDYFYSNTGLTAVKVDQYEAPVSLIARPDSDELILGERAGRVIRLRIADTGKLSVGEVILDLSDQVTALGEGGLLGLAFSPDGDYLYVSLTRSEDGQSQILAYQMNSNKPLKDTARLLLAVDQPSSDHNNGHILTDPKGRLIIGFGDGGPGLVRDPSGKGRDRSTLLGTLVRIRPTPNEDSAYLVPPENPFFNSDELGVRPEILVFGLRNPWRFDLDPLNGDLWITDVGYQLVEEINYLPANEVDSGADFGWAAMEGSVEFAGPEPVGHVRPVYEYRHDGVGVRCSIIGGVVVRGGLPHTLEGSFLYSDFCDGVIRALVPDGEGGWTEQHLGAKVDLPVHFARSHDGTVFVLSLAGGVYRLEPS